MQSKTTRPETMKRSKTRNRSEPFDLGVDTDTIYQYYTEQLLPALLASIPLLIGRMWNDTWALLSTSARRGLDFVRPQWHSENDWIQQANATLADFMLRHFDADGDGHIEGKELLNMKDILQQSRIFIESRSTTWWQWFSREWPLMDWKIGVFLWRTFGGTLLVLAMLSIVPGRLHAASGKLLRWPVLGLTYFLIGVELAVYIVIRLGIRLAEHLIARPKHRRLRRQMAVAQSYDEWYSCAAALDKSQRRDRWLKETEDETSHHYNWGFIRELITDMRTARKHGDSLLALAVIQQCTRKNVGGVMSEDLFSYSNTGEPKAIVQEFIDEVVETLHWITEEALNVDEESDHNSNDRRRYEQRFQESVRDEKDKLWKSLVDITVNLLDTKRSSGASSENSSFSDQDCAKEDSDTAPSSPSRKELPSFHREQVLNFLKRARSAYGRTALCLSGGAMMGLYHFGVVSALLEANLLPHIISGTSAGSVIGAILCTRTDEELRQDLQPEILSKKLVCFKRPWKERIKSVIKTGNLFDFDEWMDLIKWFTRGDTTFLEAYRRTGKIFCITLSSTTKKGPPVLLNYLSAPNVTIASAVIASAAVPGFISPVRLMVKDDDGVVRNQGGPKDQAFWDGSIQQDMPIKGLAEMLNCQVSGGGTVCSTRIVGLLLTNVVQFFVSSQANPHLVPFFFNAKGGVGAPSRWSGGTQEHSWRGGFLLSALEMYLKTDMKAKFHFLRDIEAAVGFTATMFTQEILGSTTITPRVRFADYFKLFSDPKYEELSHYFQAGAVAAYGHVKMISLHYKIADALDDCVAKLEGGLRRRQVERHPKKLSSDDWTVQKHGIELMDSMVSDILRERKISSSKEALAVQTSDEDEDDYEMF